MRQLACLQILADPVLSTRSGVFVDDGSAVDNFLGRPADVPTVALVTDLRWRIPGYEAEELVGFGSSGEVWRGRDTVTGETVALKRLRVSDEAANARLRREAALLAAVAHPHLVRLRDTVRSDDGWVLVLDFAAGPSLAALLRDRERLRPGEVVSALAPVAAALARAHDEGLVHGDVTPGNVLFTADGRPLLADLGVARVVCDEEPVHATPEYADPAVAGGALPGPATDIFAVAAVAFHALTGRPLWTGESAEDTLFAAAAGEVPDLAEVAPEVPEPLAVVLQRALARDPASRGSAAELALELRHACPPEPVELGTRATVVPPAARPIPLTHQVRPVPVPQPRHRRAGERGAPRRPWSRMLGNKGVRAAVLAVVSLAVAVRLGIAWASGDRDPHGTPAAAAESGPVLPSPSLTGSAVRWAAVLDRLDATRAGAFASADPSRLDAVYVPTCSGRSQDARQITAARAAGERAVGVRHRIAALRVVSSPVAGARTARAVLDVTESLTAYQVHRGAEVISQRAGPDRRYRITLQAAHGSWRIAALSLR